MKKIIRIASVIALASASLLYVGCTKDFSADLAKTNSEVAAQASKVAALEATVGTLNSTVENLKTTKADAAAVNALKEDLESKINTLTSALEQTALLAASAQADADAVAADLEVEKAKLDSIILVVDTLAIKSDSLRKDVDSLYKNSADFSKRIAALEGKVEDLAARITSINAKPSLAPQIQCFVPDTINAASDLEDVYAFVANFDIEPKTAISEITKENLKVIFKKGVDNWARAENSCHNTVKDSAYAPVSVVPHVKEGYISVIAKVAPDRITLRGTTDSEIFPYFSLVYAGKDEAGEYAVASSYTKVNASSEPQPLHEVLAVVDNETGEGLAKRRPTTYIDTVSYAETIDTVFKTVFNGRCTIKAKFNGNFISLADFAKVLGGTEKTQFPIDTTVEYHGFILFEGRNKVNKFGPAHDSWTAAENPIDWGEIVNTTELGKWQERGFTGSKEEDGLNGISTKDSVKFYKISKTDNLYYGNKTTVTTTVKVGNDHSPIAEVTDNLYIGAKNKGTFNLGTSTEDWYYDFAVSAIKDSFVVTNKNAAVALGDSTLTVTKDGKFSVKGDSTEKVQVNVDSVKYAKVAADTTYKVEWTTTANLSTKADSTFSAFNWAFKVGPRPADPATIKYAIDTTVRGTKSITKKFDTFANSVAAIKALNNRAEFGEPVIKSITINGKALDLTKSGASKRFEFASVKDGIVTFKNAAEGTTVVVATAKCAGITFTYEFTLNLTKGKTPTFKALTAYLKVEGDKSFSAEIAAPKIDTNLATQGKYVDALKTMKFNQYFVVDTTNAALADLYATFGTPDTTGHKKYFVEKGGKLDVNADKVTFGDGGFAWRLYDYDSLTTNVVAYLVYKPEQVADTIDQVNIKFWTADPIKSVVAKNVTVKHDPTKSDKVDLDSLFVIKDFVDSTVWNENGIVANRTYNYGQTIVYGADSTWTFTGGTTIKNQVSLDANHVLTLAAQGATIENAISVEIPFTVKHDLDKFGVAAEDRQGTVKVTFTK